MKAIRNMLYFLLLFVIIISSLFELITYNSFADCPPNWDSRGIYIEVNGCLYFATYCYKCGITGADGSNIRITYYSRLPREYQPNPNNCDDSEIPFDDIWRGVAQDFYQVCTIPDCSTNQTSKIIIEYPLCERYHNIAWWDSEEQRFKHFSWGESCNNDLLYCQIIRWICRLGPNEYREITTSVVPQGNFQSCIEPPIPFPPPGDPAWNESWDTDCYRTRDCVDIR